MPEVTESSTLSSLKENYTFQNNTKLKSFYEELEDVDIGNNGATCTSILQSGHTKDSEIMKLYLKLENISSKFLFPTQGFKNSKGNPLEQCAYLKYWFSDKIISNKFNDQNVKDIFYCFHDSYDKINFSIKTSDDSLGSPEMLGVQEDGYRESEESEDDEEEGVFAILRDTNFNCEINIYEVEKIKKMKLLFDYIGNYKKNENKSTINDILCDSTYKGDVNKIINLYNDSNSCNDNEPAIFCNEFKEFKNLYKIFYLNELKCAGDTTEELPEKSQLLEKGKEGFTRTQANSAFPVEGMVTDDDISSDGSVTRNNIMLTPLRSLLNKHIIRKISDRNNLLEEENSPLLHDISQSDYNDLHNSVHYIPYSLS
ncbi:Plasmodium vivax Vir protein, putative [Plasmodium ovale]|uniref:Plasmodium vivax Vir protein, putative n=1 Tax=Plasmodium ovale TaxID=36330 RepID=A0A1C3KJN6_PLAOA|nr:Plasmodium vivax Vir protein, putative [Plasmodium ovale]